MKSMSIHFCSLLVVSTHFEIEKNILWFLSCSLNDFDVTPLNKLLFKLWQAFLVPNSALGLLDNLAFL